MNPPQRRARFLELVRVVGIEHRPSAYSHLKPVMRDTIQLGKLPALMLCSHTRRYFCDDGPRAGIAGRWQDPQVPVDSNLFDQLVNWCVDRYYQSDDTPR